MKKISSFSIHPFLRQSRIILWGGVILSCLATLANFGLLFLSGWLLASASVAGIGGIVTQNLFNMTLPATGVRFFATTRIVARYAERLVTHDASLRVTGKLRTWSFQTLIPRSESLATHARSGDILTRFVRDTEQLGQFPLDIWIPCFSALICSITAISITSVFTPQGGCVLAIGMAIGGLLLPWSIGRVTDSLSRTERREITLLHNNILETIQGMADIIAYRAVSQQIKSITECQETLNKTIFKNALRTNIIRQSLPIITTLCTLIILIFAAQAVNIGALSAPEIPMLGMGTLAAFEIISPLMESRLSYERFRQASQRAVELCTLPISSFPSSENTTLPKEEVSLTLRNIYLNFNGHCLLNNIDFVLSPGERVAITGSSGTGKSTIVRLISRLINPDHGEIALGNIPLANLTTEKLSSYIGVLSQTPHLFQGSVRRNLLIAFPNATEKNMVHALTTVGLHDDVLAMEDGLDTLCGEQGVRLSGGQCRRLAAAQIILRRPSLLILDEPTESLPPDSGTQLIRNILMALPKASVLCITHRPEPLTFMNRIMCLDNGQLVEKGY